MKFIVNICTSFFIAFFISSSVFAQGINESDVQNIKTKYELLLNQKEWLNAWNYLDEVKRQLSGQEEDIQYDDQGVTRFDWITQQKIEFLKNPDLPKNALDDIKGTYEESLVQNIEFLEEFTEWAEAPSVIPASVKNRFRREAQKASKNIGAINEDAYVADKLNAWKKNAENITGYMGKETTDRNETEHFILPLPLHNEPFYELFGSPFDLVPYYNGIANAIYRNENDCRLAIPYWEKGLTQLEKDSTTENESDLKKLGWDTTGTLFRLFHCYQKTGDNEKAKESFTKLKNIGTDNLYIPSYAWGLKATYQKFQAMNEYSSTLSSDLSSSQEPWTYKKGIFCLKESGICYPLPGEQLPASKPIFLGNKVFILGFDKHYQFSVFEKKSGRLLTKIFLPLENKVLSLKAFEALGDVFTSDTNQNYISRINPITLKMNYFDPGNHSSDISSDIFIRNELKNKDPFSWFAHLDFILTAFSMGSHESLEMLPPSQKEEYFQIIMESLASPNNNYLIGYALHCLAFFYQDHPEVLDILLEALIDENPSIRVEAKYSLHHIFGESIMDEDTWKLFFFKDQDEIERLNTKFSDLKKKDRVFLYLLQLLKKDNNSYVLPGAWVGPMPDFQKQIALFLILQKQYLEEALPIIYDRSFKEIDVGNPAILTCLKKIVREHPEKIIYLIDWVSAKSFNDQFAAYGHLEEIHNDILPISTPVIIQVLQREIDKDHRRYCISTLRQIKEIPSQLIHFLANLLTMEEDTQVRREIISTLFPYAKSNNVAMTALLQATHHLEVETRKYAIETLGRISPSTDAIVDVLIEGLNDPEAIVRLEAANVFSRTEPKFIKALPHLIRKLDDPDSEVKRLASGRLAFVVSDMEDKKMAHETIEALVNAFKNTSDLEVQANILNALNMIEIGETKELPSPNIIPLFTEALKSTHAKVIAGAAMNLGNMGRQAKSALPALYEAENKAVDMYTIIIIDNAISKIEGSK